MRGRDLHEAKNGNFQSRKQQDSGLTSAFKELDSDRTVQSQSQARKIHCQVLTIVLPHEVSPMSLPARNGNSFEAPIGRRASAWPDERSQHHDSIALAWPNCGHAWGTCCHSTPAAMVAKTRERAQPSRASLATNTDTRRRSGLKTARRFSITGMRTNASIPRVSKTAWKSSG